MSFELFVALRYLRAKRKNIVISFVSFLSILGVIVGVSSLVVVTSMYGGLITNLRSKIADATAHITILSVNRGYIRQPEYIIKKIEKCDEIVGVTPVTYLKGLLIGKISSEGCVIKGVDFRFPGAVDGNLFKLKNGSIMPLERDSNGIVIGYELAKKIGVRVGDYVKGIFPQGRLTPFGFSPTIKKFKVIGIFSSGLYDYDSMWGYVNIKVANRILSIPSDGSQFIDLKVKDVDLVKKIEHRIKKIIGNDFSFSDWIDRNKPLFSALKLEELGLFLAISLIVIVAALNIITTLTMMVMEKQKDIGILLSMGARPNTISKIFMYQGLIIGILGGILGAILGVSISLLCEKYHWIKIDKTVYSLSYLPFKIDWMLLVFIFLGGVLITFLATLYPAYKGSNVNPIEALRNE